MQHNAEVGLFTKPSNADDLVRHLHGGDDIEHIRGLAHLFLVEKVEMGQAGAADQDMKPLLFILF